MCVVCHALFAVRRSLRLCYCSLLVACCSLCLVRCVLRVVCCLFLVFRVGCCLVLNARCLFFVASRVLFVVCSFFSKNVVRVAR